MSIPQDQLEALRDADTLHLIPLQAHIVTIKDLASECLALAFECNRLREGLKFYADYARWPNGDEGMGALAQTLLADAVKEPNDG